MGEVYRARDTRLGREVAIKVVSDSFVSDPERMARFKREAHLLASLNHPHIATVHGLEQSDGTPFLVMELVEGETIAERLAAGPLPLDEAVRLATEIADALNAAHEKGIVHRDLKPANIALTNDGHVKVLDFGLAKTLDPLPSDDTANSPTMTLAATKASVLLGTAAYMAPEQAKGRPADKRSDIWAFGCVLYEMLTGRRAFAGDDVGDTMAAVLRDEPDWNAFPAGIPQPIHTLVQRCLTKDWHRRIADISIARYLLTEPALARLSAGSGIGAAPSRWQRLVIPLAAALLSAAVTAAVFTLRRAPAKIRVSRLAIPASPGTSIAIGTNDRDLAISPDGQRIAYIGAGGTIYVRSIDRLEPTPLRGLGSPRGLFFSPDGLWIGYGDGGSGALKKVSVTGGPPITVSPLNGAARGAVWLRDRTIVFATDEAATGLLRVADGGGDPAVVTRPDAGRGEADHWWPELSADDRYLIFTIRPRTGDVSQIAVLDLSTNQYRTVIKDGSDGRQLSTGHVIYMSGSSVRAVHLDLERAETTSNSTIVIPDITVTQWGAAELDVARDGTVVYAPGGAQSPRTLAWFDRQGREEPIGAPPRAYQYVRISPDGTRAALDVRDQEFDIWVWTFAGGPLRRLTFGAFPDRFPVWSHDGRRIFFGSDRDGVRNVFVQSADGTGAAERVIESQNQQVPMSATPDGNALVVRDAGQIQDLLLVPLPSERQARPLIKTASAEQNGEVSPDGRWLAYESNDSSQFEVFVRPFPNVDGGKWQISMGGGTQPAWSRDGRELFYLSANAALMSVKVEAKGAWNAAAPVKVFEARQYSGVGPGNGTGRTYDVSVDGRRFLMIKQAEEGTATVAPLVVVQNWFEELNKLVPGK